MEEYFFCEDWIMLGLLEYLARIWEGGEYPTQTQRFSPLCPKLDSWENNLEEQLEIAAFENREYLDLKQ